MRKTILIVIVLSLIYSCDPKNSIKDNIAQMIGKEIVIDSCQMRRIDVATNYRKQTEYLLICYMDSAECKTCAINKLHEWDSYMSSFKDDTKMELLFVINSDYQNADFLSMYLASQKVKHSIYIDTLGLFEKNNSFIPRLPPCHVFLCRRKTGEILLVGNPVTNQNIDTLLRKVINNQE